MTSFPYWNSPWLAPRPPSSGNHLSDPGRGPGLQSILMSVFPARGMLRGVSDQRLGHWNFAFVTAAAVVSGWGRRAAPPPPPPPQQGAATTRLRSLGRAPELGLPDGGRDFRKKPRTWQVDAPALPRCLCRSRSACLGALPLLDFVPVSFGGARQRPWLPW